MHEMVSLTEIDDQAATELKWPRHADLRRAAQGEVSLYEAFQTLVRYREAHAQTAAELFERETWAMTVLVDASESLWTQPASPTLRFAIPGPDGPAPYHLELGRFAHLAALQAPSEEEQELIAAASPRWARVHAHQERLHEGQTGALACRYVPMSTGEAVATLGFARILAQLECRARAVGTALLTQAEEQDARQQRVQQAERMLGWVPTPAVDSHRAHSPGTRLLLSLVQEGCGQRLAVGTTLLGAMTVLFSFVVGVPHALLLLLLALPVLLLWNYMITS